MMKLALILVLTLLVDISICQTVVPGKLLLLQAAQEPLPSCNGFYGIRCGDCTRLQVCAGGKNEVASYDCGQINSNTPYCVNRGCSSKPSSDECEQTAATSSFQCTSAGFFPNTNDCSKYFLCPGAGENPKVFECPRPFIYSSKREGCVRRIFQAECTLINCSKKPGSFQVYPSDRSILVYCPANAEYPILTRCPDPVNQEYDETTLQCSTVCHSQGRFADKLNCHKYYQCIRRGGKFTKIEVDCSPLSYDASVERCVVSNGCQNEITTPTALPPSTTTSPVTTTTSPQPATTTPSPQPVTTTTSPQIITTTTSPQAVTTATSPQIVTTTTSPQAVTTTTSPQPATTTTSPQTVTTTTSPQPVTTTTSPQPVTTTTSPQIVTTTSPQAVTTTTTSQPVTTTAPSSETSRPSSGTSESSSGTSKPSSGTSEPSSGTSEAPSGTSESPPGTSEAPSGTSEQQSGSSEQSSGTSEAPSGTSEPSLGTSEAPSGSS